MVIVAGHPDTDVLVSPIGVGGSKVVSCLAVVRTPANLAFGYTRQVANKLKLTQVKAYFVPNWVGGADWVDFEFFAGTGEPQNYAQLDGWDRILPVRHLGVPGLEWRKLGGDQQFCWDMNVPFRADGLRFAIRLSAAGAITYQEFYASFQIWEGM